jgi:hypothetical protein
MLDASQQKDQSSHLADSQPRAQLLCSPVTKCQILREPCDLRSPLGPLQNIFVVNFGTKQTLKSGPSRQCGLMLMLREELFCTTPVQTSPITTVPHFVISKLAALRSPCTILSRVSKGSKYKFQDCTWLAKTAVSFSVLDPYVRMICSKDPPSINLVLYSQ